MKRPLLLALIALVLLVPTVWLWWPATTGGDEHTALTAAQAAALTDEQLVPVLGADLRWKAARASAFAKWRNFDAPARHLFALYEIERYSIANVLVGFPGIVSLTTRRGPQMPTLDEIAEAYSAIGATQAAAAIRTTRRAQQAGTPRYEELNQAFQHAVRADDSFRRLRRYVRDHLQSVVDAQVHD